MLFRIFAFAAVAATSVEAGFWSSGERKVEEETPKEPRQLDEPVEYGVDVSFPMQYASVSDNYAWLPHNLDPSLPTPDRYKDMAVQPLGDRKSFYQEYVDGCREKFGTKGSRCTQSEIDRFAMSLRQPQSMQNYTELGFQKIRAPSQIYGMIKDFWDANKDKAKRENWGVGNTYTNNWASPTEMVSVEDSTLRGGGKSFKQQIWNAAREVIQEWTGEELTECSLYGIRVYHEGSVLATHVDRLPLVSSAIINVAQDIDEPWPIEVYGHDGRAHNVTMEPGDMVLYESHSVLHGRPFPLKGRFYANLFVHFEPVGHSLRHNAETDAGGDVHKKYRDALKRGAGGHEVDESGLPPYIIPGTPEEDHWRRAHPSGNKSKRKSSTTGSTVAHLAAQGGDIEALKGEVTKRKEIIHTKDENGWTPLHEGARGGHLDVVQYLVSNGADPNVRTGSDGGTALWWAKKTLDEDHPVISFLESIGGLEIGPDL
mmetsp:Transcript_110502/g.165388  ORF Transcript_110502/g.165388 Transcript_110502/m.165388 type:complete len:484 (-) Transcript_110502:266-1717(-)|eukprot:CAMPEP_0117046038 /NCGR_PEP_ID=MMETSP0472-20121206/31844_1 /TAXON_ID=693140 ORGANISM="Tiarina fusus, Strain LIS" /NCGR_SAMPLE_ID=MMETSP0472 /ASSEMBLY_ACC=CAM_ASM_000603 /LENGTH=483 /DNA_ID=CAMNT_0004758259 /DNA_START=117 /DNA_END=1568 /DNA_ORIENTATION=+